MPTDVTGRDPVAVGRIRQDLSHPQALELWITHRLMLLDHLSAQSGKAGPQRGNLSLMAASLGFELDAAFWQLLDQSR